MQKKIGADSSTPRDWGMMNRGRRRVYANPPNPDSLMDMELIIPMMRELEARRRRYRRRVQFESNRPQRMRGGGRVRGGRGRTPVNVRLVGDDRLRRDISREILQFERNSEMGSNESEEEYKLRYNRHMANQAFLGILGTNMTFVSQRIGQQATNEFTLQLD